MAIIIAVACLLSANHIIAAPPDLPRTTAADIVFLLLAAGFVVETAGKLSSAPHAVRTGALPRCTPWRRLVNPVLRSCKRPIVPFLVGTSNALYLTASGMPMRSVNDGDSRTIPFAYVLISVTSTPLPLRWKSPMEPRLRIFLRPLPMAGCLST